jgi:hypothetical protein
MKRRTARMKPIWSHIPGLIKPALRRRGFQDSNLIKDWAIIVGPQFAEYSSPECIRYANKGKIDGTLHLCVHGSAAMLMKHIEDQIVERVNRYCGYKAVARITMHQSGEVKSNAKENVSAQKKIIPIPKNHSVVDKMNEGPLKEALKKFGNHFR